MPVTVPLNESSSTTLDVNGNGVAFVGPLSAREIWSPVNAHVSANAQPVNDAQCQVFVGDNTVTPANYRDGTFAGSSGDSTDRIDADTIKCGHYVFAVWTGGDSGVTATLTVTGSKTV